MMCYRDTTFCARAEQCTNHEKCPKWFSPEEEAAAERWWKGEDVPVAFSNFEACKDYHAYPSS